MIPGMPEFEDIEDSLEAEQGGQIHRGLFYNNPLPMLVYDLETLRILMVNDALVRHHGYSREEFLSMTIKDIRPSEDIPRLLENVAEVTSGLDKAGIWRHRKKDGSIVMVDITSHTLSVRGRKAELVLIVDVTEQKRMEQALRESEQFIRNVILNAGEGVVVYDCDFRYVLWNGFMERLTGISAADVLGKNAFETFPHLREQGVDVLMRRALAGETVHSGDVPFRVGNKHGWVEGTYVPNRSSDGVITGVIATVRESTARRRAEDTLRQSIQEKEVLLREVHHRVKNNLQMMIALTEMHREKTIDSEGISVLEDLGNRMRAVALVHEGLYRFDDLSRISMSPFIEELMNNIAGVCNSSGRINLACIIDEAKMEVDPAVAVALIVNELLTNAFRHAFPQGGEFKDPRIEVRLEKKEDGLLLSVSDNGVGISPEAQNAEKTLGLSLVKLLARHQLNAGLVISSAGGTCVGVSIPILPPAAL